MRTIAEFVALPTTRDAVSFQYATAHDHFAEQEQLARNRLRDIEAEGFREFARLVVAAWLAEQEDPQPRMDLPLYSDACPGCLGIGSVRIRRGNGGQRQPCEECGGSGTARPGPRRKEDR